MGSITNLATERLNRARRVPIMGELQPLAKQYLHHLSTAGLSDNTLLAHGTDLGQFISICEQLDITLVQHVTAQAVQDFVDSLINGAGVSRRTAERKLRCVKGFLTYVCLRGVIQRNPADAVKPPKWHAQPVIAPEESVILKMIESIPTEGAENIRDRALFSLMYSAGLRIGGLLSLDLFDPVNPPPYFAHPISGVVQYQAKGGRTEVSTCDAVTLRRIEAWLAVRHRYAKNGGEKALFLSQQGRRPTRATISIRLKQHAARVGIKHMHCHLLRHRRGGEVMEHAGLRAATNLLGHKQTTTTANVYGHHSAERMRHTIQTLAPVKWGGQGDE